VSQAFSTTTTGWVIFGISLGALAVLPIVIQRAENGSMLVDVLTGLLALWSAVASVVFSGATLKWTSFADAIAFVVVGVAGLLVHEVTTGHFIPAAQRVSGDDRTGEQELQAAA
jgi:hypothetical protein